MPRQGPHMTLKSGLRNKPLNVRLPSFQTLLIFLQHYPHMAVRARGLYIDGCGASTGAE